MNQNIDSFQAGAAAAAAATEVRRPQPRGRWVMFLIIQQRSATLLVQQLRCSRACVSACPVSICFQVIVSHFLSCQSDEGSRHKQ